MLLLMELVILCAVFWILCYLGIGTDEKNIKSFSSYPDRVQELIRKDPILSKNIKESSVTKTFISNIIMFAFILMIFGLFLRSNDFVSNFINLIILGEFLNLFDYLVIDMMWWRNSERIRFKSIDDNQEIYKDMSKHKSSFIRGVVMFLIVAVIDGLLLTIL